MQTQQQDFLFQSSFKSELPMPWWKSEVPRMERPLPSRARVQQSIPPSTRESEFSHKYAVK